MKEWILENTNITEPEYDNTILILTSNTYKPSNEPINNIFNNQLVAIHTFTYKKPSTIRKILFNVKGKEDTYLHKNIKFKILAEQLENITSNLKYEDIEQLKKILYSIKRDHKCFSLSLQICDALENCYITTALCKNPYCKKESYFLHTFLIIEKNKTEYIIDSTFNIIMKKHTYLNLFKAKIISKIDKETFLKDMEYIKNCQFANHINFSEYLCFKDEVMQAAKKLSKQK